MVGDWGLGSGDWAHSPIPNPQSPFYITITETIYITFNIYTDYSYLFNI